MSLKQKVTPKIIVFIEAQLAYSLVTIHPKLIVLMVRLTFCVWMRNKDVNLPCKAKDCPAMHPAGLAQ